ncbi:MAG: hypothetical protein EOP51_20600 [Sphingobacteriales bacterium]|nr:MAG: hypothetical protein EOP51_20600 [Sphingobacteriales bacterium]
MKRKPLLGRRLLLCTTVCALLSGAATTANAQLTKTFATQPISHSTGSLGTFNVTDFANASDTILSTSATLNAQTTLVLSSNSHVEVGFAANVPAGATLYVPVQDDPTVGLLSALAGGSLGDLLTGLLSNRSFTVEIKTPTGTLVTYTSAGNGPRVFTQGSFGFVRDAAGQVYITFRANAGVNYSRVRVTANTGGLVGAAYELKVQDAYYLGGTATPCAPFLTTAFDAAGVSLSLLNANGNPVKNIENVIDADTTNFSTFGYGTVNVGALNSISQDVYFSNLSQPGEQAKIKFQVPQTLLALGVVSNVNITAYRNDTIVSDGSLSSLLSLQALGILTVNLGNSIPAYVQVPVPITEQFNRIRVTYNVLVATGANQTLNLYGVDRVPPQPTLNSTAMMSCPSTAGRFSITNVTPGVSYAWYNSANVLVSTDTFYAPMMPALGVTDTYYVTSSTCPGKESVGTVFTATGSNAQCVAVSPIAYLGGAFDATLNRNKNVTVAWEAILEASAFTHPYAAAPFNYTGTVTVDPLIFTTTPGDTDIVDWMLLELKDSTGNTIDRKVAFILENGNITNPDKTQPIVMKAVAGRYHLTVRHRNHLGLSTNLMDFAGGNNSFDYTTATDATLFGDANAYTTINGKTLMIAGNTNGNGFISYSGSGNDRAILLTSLGGNNTTILTDIYHNSDLNLSGSVFYSGSGNDRAVILNALNGNVSGVILEQIK